MKYIKLFAVAVFLAPASLFGQFLFKDVTPETGIFMQSTQVAEAGPGVIVFDLNGDGWDDIYMPGGQDSDKLWLNNGNGTFTNIARPNFFMHQTLFPDTLTWRTNPRGGIAFDYDNDGHPDLYVVCENRDILWHNRGDNTFEDATLKAKLQLPIEKNESNGASFGDFDGDGWNDFYVARWIDENRLASVPGKDSVYAHKGFPNYFYINNHDGTFTESAYAYGVSGDTGTTNVALFFDYDRDGDLDLFIGNDFGVEEMPNQVWKNMLMETGKATFVDVTKEIRLQAHLFCMGICPIDYNNDRNFDFYETSIGPDSVYKNNGDGTFSNVTATIMPEGLKSGAGGNGYERRGTEMTTTWTPLAGDFDNDGLTDLFVVHGFEGVIAPWHTNFATQKDTSVFYHNFGGRFEDYTDQALSGDYLDFRGRGAAYLDYDHDGRLDICIGSMGTDPLRTASDFRMLRNITPRTSDLPAHWLEMRFTAVRTAKEAIGTTVDVWTPDGVVHSRQVSTGGGFGSQNSLMQHVGLADNAKVDSIIIYWPCDKYRHRQIDRYYHIGVDTVLNFVEQTVNSVTPEPQDVAKIYPSPAREVLNITGLKPAMRNFEIYDLLGQKRIEVSCTDAELSLPVSKLRPGYYVLRIITDAKVETRQFIKE